jgi:hypothetical protein
MARWMLPHTAETATVPGELVLVAAVLHQPVTDAQSRQATIRAEAQAFLHDPIKLGFWTDLVGIEPAAFRERVAAALRPPREA